MNERTDAKRALHVAFVDFQHERSLRPGKVHKADDLVGKVGVVPASEAHELHVLERVVLRGEHGRREHARVEIVHHVEAALRQIDLVHVRNRIGCENGNAEFGEVTRQLVVHERVVLVGSACEHDGERPVTLHLVSDSFPSFRELRLEGALRGFGGGDGALRLGVVDAEIVLQVLGELA